MIERPLMTVDELKSMPKGHFIVMKTGCHPMKTRLTITYTYDLMNGLKSVTTYDGSTIKYDYDNASRLTAVETPFRTTQYEYDLMDRLVRVVVHDGMATVYEYDVNGNRTAVRLCERNCCILRI